MKGRIVQLNCSDGGVPKWPVSEAFLTLTGLAGDRQARPRFHGGPERALCLFALELIRQLQLEGHPIFPGSAGENVTMEGLDWSCLTPGRRLALGEQAIVQISSYTVPCRTIARSFMGGKFQRIDQEWHPGEARLYARVLQTGRLAVGQAVHALNDIDDGETT